MTRSEKSPRRQHCFILCSSVFSMHFAAKALRAGLLTGLVLLELLCASNNSAGQGKTKALPPSSANTPVYQNISPDVEYVGSEVCAGCHRDIYEQYGRTDMGRSMSLASQASQLEKNPSNVTVFSEKFNRYFQISREGADLFQSEYEVDSEGKEVFRSKYKIEYVIGSGANGHSYAIRRGDYLFQAPLSFYSKPKKWDLSPGYEFNDYGFSRPIEPGCIVCHSGLPQPVAQGGGLYRNPPFLELAIGCENCHGPGQRHVEGRAKGLRVPRGKDLSIVNPAHLPPWMADNICMNCHQGGDTRVLQPGKDYNDFRPGTPLNDTVAIFRVPFDRNSPPDSDLLEHYSSMILSKCYQKSGGKLSCLSCHNPHSQPSSQEAPAYFRGKCLNCHTNQSCSLPLSTRQAQDPPNDCAHCHLPKRDIKVIAHSALSNHRIVARQGQPFPDAAFQQGTPGLTDLIHVNAVPGRGKETLPPRTLFHAYGELANSRPAYQKPYLELLDKLAKTETENTLVLSALARKSKLEGSPQGEAQALQYLTRSIELGSKLVSDYADLAEVLARSGRNSEAIEILKRGITLAPYSPVFYKSLALRYISIKNYTAALQTMKRHLELFPEDSFMRKLVMKVENDKREGRR